MEGNKQERHWLNPLYKTGTESSLCSSRSAPAPTSEPPRFRSDKDMNRLLRYLSQSWKTIKDMPSVSSFMSMSRDEKEVVMEGYLPTTKQSVLNFLKGMGLKPKVDVVGKDTIVTADVSAIRDEKLKQRFIKFMKRQVVDTPRTSVASTSSKASSSVPLAPSMKSIGSSETSKDTTKTSDNSETTAHSTKGKIWTPPKLFDEADDKKKKDKKKKADRPGSGGKQDAKKCPSKNKDLDDVDAKKDEKKKEKSVGFKTVGMVPMVGHLENPFDRQILIPTATPIRGDDDHLDQAVWTQPLRNLYAGSSVEYGMSNTSSLMQEHSIEAQPSCGDQQVTQELQTSPSKNKKKKLRIAKHLRKWFSKKKRAEEQQEQQEQISLETSKDDGTLEASDQSQAISRETYGFNSMGHFETVSVAPAPVPVPVAARFYGESPMGKRRNGKVADDVPVTAKLYVDRQDKNRKSVESTNKRSTKIKINPQAFDGSISMPVLIAPDQSCFKSKHCSSLRATSKSSTNTSDKKCQAKDTYRVVGDTAAIHIGKKRIRLEGEDVKYGSILQKDADFDERFHALKENSMSDIESQVRKAKERIMFARAMGAVGDRLPEGFPKVDYKELLMPKKNNQEERSLNRRSNVNIATTTSFYQKFIASMNILKATHRLNACDRSVMTDEPHSKTYAQFMDAMNERNLARGKSSISAHSRSSRRSMENVTPGDSSVDLPTSSYLKMICTCWEPLFKFFPDIKNERENRNRRPPENAKTEEEKILKYIVDKVVDCSRNKKGYIKT